MKDKNHIDCFVVCGKCGKHIPARGRVDSEPASNTGRDLIIHLEATEEMIEEGKVLCSECNTNKKTFKEETKKIVAKEPEKKRIITHYDEFGYDPKTKVTRTGDEL